MQPSDRYIKTEVRFVKPENGGRRRQHLHLLNGYRPHFRVLPDSTYLGIQFEGGTSPVQFDQVVPATVRLLYDGVDYSLLIPGAQFEILEGPIIVGYGTVLE